MRIPDRIAILTLIHFILIHNVGTHNSLCLFFLSLPPPFSTKPRFFFHKDHYPFPIASAGIQLGIVSFLLAILSILRHFIEKCHRRGQPSKVTSWIFGPGVSQFLCGTFFI